MDYKAKKKPRASARGVSLIQDMNSEYGTLDTRASQIVFIQQVVANICNKSIAEITMADFSGITIPANGGNAALGAARMVLIYQALNSGNENVDVTITPQLWGLDLTYLADMTDEALLAICNDNGIRVNNSNQSVASIITADWNNLSANEKIDFLNTNFSAGDRSGILAQMRFTKVWGNTIADDVVTFFKANEETVEGILPVFIPGETNLILDATSSMSAPDMEAFINVLGGSDLAEYKTFSLFANKVVNVDDAAVLKGSLKDIVKQLKSLAAENKLSSSEEDMGKVLDNILKSLSSADSEHKETFIIATDESLQNMPVYADMEKLMETLNLKYPKVKIVFALTATNTNDVSSYRFVSLSSLRNLYYDKPIIEAQKTIVETNIFLDQYRVTVADVVALGYSEEVFNNAGMPWSLNTGYVYSPVDGGYEKFLKKIHSSFGKDFKGNTLTLGQYLDMHAIAGDTKEALYKYIAKKYQMRNEINASLLLEARSKIAKATRVLTEIQVGEGDTGKRVLSFKNNLEKIIDVDFLIEMAA